MGTKNNKNKKSAGIKTACADAGCNACPDMMRERCEPSPTDEQEMAAAKAELVDAITKMVDNAENDGFIFLAFDKHENVALTGNHMNQSRLAYASLIIAGKMHEINGEMKARQSGLASLLREIGGGK